MEWSPSPQNPQDNIKNPEVPHHNPPPHEQPSEELNLLNRRPQVQVPPLNLPSQHVDISPSNSPLPSLPSLLEPKISSSAFLQSINQTNDSYSLVLQELRQIKSTQLSQSAEIYLLKEELIYSNKKLSQSLELLADTSANANAKSKSKSQAKGKNKYINLRSSDSNSDNSNSSSSTPSTLTATPQTKQEELELVRRHSRWRAITSELCELRTSNHGSNFSHISRIIADNSSFFAPVLKTFPNFRICLCFVMTSSSFPARHPSNDSSNRSRKINPAPSMTIVTNLPTKHLNELSKEEAATIGKDFKRHLANKEYKTAVDAWRCNNPVLQQLFDEFHFESMMNMVAKKLLVQSNLGLRRRVFVSLFYCLKTLIICILTPIPTPPHPTPPHPQVGAALSIGDMISDVIVIFSYNSEGKKRAARSLATMIGLSLTIQLSIVYAQNYKKKKRILLRECLILFSGLKPAVDAYRVATGYVDIGSNLNPLVEMASVKGTELACESIPGSLLQVSE